MKKTIISMMLVLAGLTAQAQESNRLADFVKERMVFGIQADWSAGSNTHLSQNLDLGVMLGRRLYPFASLGNDWLLCKQDGVRTYGNTTLLGGGLGFRALNNPEQRMSLDVRMKVQQSIGSHSMNCTLYDVSAYARLGGKVFVPMFGVGVRHEHMHTSGLSHQNYMYLSIGMGL